MQSFPSENPSAQVHTSQQDHTHVGSNAKCKPLFMNYLLEMEKIDAILGLTFNIVEFLSF